MKILVTGGAGFIGSAVCRYIINNTEDEVVNVDALTYAADLSTLDTVSENSRYQFEQADIRSLDALNNLFDKHSPDAVMHLAAESHVDRSIDGPKIFIETNVMGTYNLLQAARKYYETLSGPKKQSFKFHHISTDEVYGSLGDTGAFVEDDAYEPNSPYSASKASSDHLVRAWHHTFGLPVVISNCSNNYGPYQFPEKFIPVLTLNALEGKKLPIYGQGLNVRDWLHVEDHAEALYLVLTKGRLGEKYNIGGDAEKQNIEIADMVCSILDELSPKSYEHKTLITYVDDRPGHDHRYAIDFSKINNELGWSPRHNFEDGLKQTVEWYMTNQQWWQNISSGAYKQRLGLAGAA